MFGLVAMGREVRQLEVIIPAILLFYNSANVIQDVMNKKTEKQLDNDPNSTKS